MRFWVILLLLFTISYVSAAKNRKTSTKDKELPELAGGDSQEVPADDKDDEGKKTVSKKKPAPKKKVEEETAEEDEATSIDDAQLARMEEISEQLSHYIPRPPEDGDKKKGKESKSTKTKTSEKKKPTEEEETDLMCTDKESESTCICEDNRMDCHAIVYDDNGEDLSSTNVVVTKKNFKMERATFENNAIIALTKGKILPGREKELQELILSRNRIMRIESGSFEGFTELKKLYLNKNKLTKLNKEMFKGLSGLHKLYLEDNKLTEIDSSVFSELKELKRLSLDGNKLKFNATMFSTLEKLEELSLDNCGIDDKFPVNIFDKLKNLKKLSIRNNPYIEVPRAVNALDKLEYLDMSGSNIPELHGQSLKDDHKVKSIYMENMPYLSIVHDCAFCGLEQLEEVHLSNSSQLFEINENAFGYAKMSSRQVVSLKKLYVENCNISSISEEMLYYDKVEELGIGGNPLVCDCETAFLMGSKIYDFEYTNVLPKCAHPEKLEGQPLAKLEPAKACDSIREGNTVWRGVKVLSIMFLLTMLAAGVFMLYSRGMLQSCYKSARHGAPAFPSMTYSNLNNTEDGRSLEQDFQPRPEEV